MAGEAGPDIHLVYIVCSCGVVTSECWSGRTLLQPSTHVTSAFSSLDPGLDVHYASPSYMQPHHQSCLNAHACSQCQMSPVLSAVVEAAKASINLECMRGAKSLHEVPHV